MKLLTLNIEGDRHIDRVVTFLKRESPEILCLQEVFQDTAMRIASLGYNFSLLPMTLKRINGVERVMGTAVFVKNTGTAEFHSMYYRTTRGELPEFNKERQKETIWHGIVFARYVFEENEYHIGSTHFTWTEDGAHPSTSQVRDLNSLLKKVRDEPAHILCGDFNIPRHHNDLYKKLTGQYKDTVPEHYASSLDRTLHRFGRIKEKSLMFDAFMVDYIFSQPPYLVSDVRLEFGISDHAAVIGHVSVR